MMKMMDLNFVEPPVELVTHFKAHNISLHIKREDLIHPFVSGNKFRKLKYNLQEAKKNGSKTILTFGGAFSNHIAAVAAAGKLLGFKTIGIIRGEELGVDLNSTLNYNSTLRFAKEQGMGFHFINREKYREKDSSEFIEKLKFDFGDFYLIPEGGTNELAVKGCEEIMTDAESNFEIICCAVGTGGTISGIINASHSDQKVLGFPALKGDFLSSEIRNFTSKTNWELVTDYHFGGYAKVNEELINFLNNFKRKYQIALDPIYTGKMIFGIFDLIEKSSIPENSRILAVHTGGLQGIEGMNKQLSKKKLPLIEI